MRNLSGFFIMIRQCRAVKRMDAELRVLAELDAQIKYYAECNLSCAHCHACMTELIEYRNRLIGG